MRFCSIICAEKRIFSAIFFLVFLLAGLQSSAQSESVSPYSRYGIGDLAFNGFVKNIGMGGIGMAERPLFNINFVNPASYSALWLTEFDIAMSANFTQMSTTSLSQKKSGTTFSYFALGFPVKDKKWGAAFGLVPFSSVGYKIVSNVAEPNADVTYTYEGTGGINRFFIGNAFTIRNNFSAGFNASYLFGSIDRISTAAFSGTTFFNSRYTSGTTIGDIYFDFGLQQVFDSLKIAKSDSVIMYDKLKKNLNDSIEALTEITDTLTHARNMDAAAVKLQMDSLQKNIFDLKSRLVQADSARKLVVTRKQKSGWSLTAGLTFAAPTKISAKEDSLTEIYQGNANFILVRDTIMQKEGEKGTINLPLSLGFGFAFKKGNQWLIGADIAMQNWGDDYSYFGKNDSLTNSMRVSSGFQYTPHERMMKPYLKNIQYRFGAFYHQTYLQLKGTQLNEYGVTAGLGLPIISKGSIVSKAASFATIQLSATFGSRGTTDNNLLREDFARISFGITFSDRWFIKSKFD